MSDTKPNTLDQPEVTAFFDAQTNTISYIVKEPSGNACAVIDSV
ncbi:MAG: MBL fold metallo-hydrolase, partial [Paracoccaceae bacterium]